MPETTNIAPIFRTIGATTELSVDQMDHFYSVVCKDVEQELLRRAYREGFGFTHVVKHRKEIVTRTNELTGVIETVCVVISSVQLQPLKGQKNA